ncbi:MAG: toll/interleukin-1 receptor domain-containing protein [Angustibacter sp.]
MANYTLRQARDAATRVGGTTTFSSANRLRSEAKTGRSSYDVFLSHAYLDAQLILGVKAILESAGMSVYVDWLDDEELDRATVTAATASKLRERMRQSKSLVFATSRASVDSKWMPWELGYFDGLRGSGRIAIFPLVAAAGDRFVGQEYLGLYPRIQQLRRIANYIPEAVVTRGNFHPESMSLRGFVAGSGSFSKATFQ